jgi:beta-lactamase superfamily II metal-dependent hydrolase
LVDELVAKLPQRDGKPYLSCFVLTHPDQDHCRGFADLLKRVVINCVRRQSYRAGQHH